jgi:hypothetical protein
LALSGLRESTLVASALMALAVPSLPAGHAAPAADPRALAEAVVEAYGGRAALEPIRAYRMEGRIAARLRGQEGPMRRLFARPDRLRVELDYPDEPELRIVNGAQGWRSIGGDPEPVSGPLLDAMVLQAARAAVPWVLMEHMAELETIAPQEHMGRRLLGLGLHLEHGLALELYVDPASHRVLWSRGRLTHGGMETAFETEYGDFRRVGQAWFAFHEENYASGAHTGATTIERVELNPKLRLDAFAPPRVKSAEL